MNTYLLAANPIHGHVGPILQVARHLVASGHAVTVLTGGRFAESVAAVGAGFRRLVGRADYDDREPDAYLPERELHRGVRRVEYEIRTIFVETVPDQYRSLRAAIDDLAPDAVLVDGAFGGALPLMLQTSVRPPVLGLGVAPLTQTSRDLAPHGMAMPPARGPLTRLRYRVLDEVARRILFRSMQDAGKRVFAECGATLEGFVLDASGAFDRFLQTGPASLEYPRSDLTANVRFVGVLPQRAGETPLPDWWDDLDRGRPVVHVTQGTIDNHDFTRLVRPTIEALADRDVIVVASAGGRDPLEIGALPANARAERYLPYEELLARTDVFVTNGGFGGVQAAVAAGVPIVVAGDTEEKPEVAARVAYAGVGIDLKTGMPDAAAVRAAVDTVLADPAYRARARRLAADAAEHDALTEISRHLADTTVTSTVDARRAAIPPEPGAKGGDPA